MGRRERLHPIAPKAGALGTHGVCPHWFVATPIPNSKNTITGATGPLFSSFPQQHNSFVSKPERFINGIGVYMRI